MDEPRGDNEAHRSPNAGDDRIWSALQRLCSASSSEPTWSKDWDLITRSGRLFEWCRRELAERRSARIRQALQWTLTRDRGVNYPRIDHRIEYVYGDAAMYRSVHIEALRLCRAVRGELASALLAGVAIKEPSEGLDIEGLVAAASEAVAQWNGASESDVAEVASALQRLSWPSGRAPDALLGQLPHGRWQVGPIRDWLAALAGKPRPYARRYKTPVLGYMGSEGFVAWLCLETSSNGTGDFYPEPTKMNFMPLTHSFLEAVETAWTFVRQQSRWPPRGCNAPVDIRWWLEGGEFHYLDGGSMGAALANALWHMLEGKLLEEDIAITGRVNAAGQVLHVECVPEKVEAALKLYDRVGRPLISHVIVPPADLEQANQAAHKRRPGLSHAVGSAETVAHIPQCIIDHRQHVTEEIAALAHDYSGRVRNFVQHYLGSPKDPMPFGGRDDQFDELERWLSDASAAPYLFLTAEAGRGKSALLVRWTQTLLNRQNLSVVFFPISIRFHTSLPKSAFAGLSQALLALHGDPPKDLDKMSASDWRIELANLLAKRLANGRRLLVIIDGWDELASREADSIADLFPQQPDPGLRVIVSARSQPHDPDGQLWRRRFAWESPSLGHTMQLAPLDLQGISGVLQRMGFPLDELSRNVDMVAELHRLSDGGDPLLLRFYVQDLWQQGDRSARLQPEDLKSMEPGWKGYITDWWSQQKTLWKRQKSHISNQMETVLSLLACALGPLDRQDLLNLAPAELKLNSLRLESVLEQLARFIVGDGREQGYVFQHPRLGYFFREEKLTTDERKFWDRRFLKWGEQTVARLDAGQITPEEVPGYLLRYYGLHLDRTSHQEEKSLLSTPGELVPFLLPLTKECWCNAWQALDTRQGLGNGYSGFMTDVERVWRTTEQVDRHAVATGGVAVYVGQGIRCALIQASINSLSSNLPAEFLVTMVQSGTWPPALAVSYARQKPSVEDRTEALTRLLPCIGDSANLASTVAEAWAAAQQITEKDVRVCALSALAPYLTAAQHRQILLSLRETEDGLVRCRALSTLTPHLQVDELQEALIDTLQREDANNRSRALSVLGPYLSIDQLREALDAPLQKGDMNEWYRTLSALGPYLSVEQLHEALDATLRIKDVGVCFGALRVLAPRLSAEELQKARTAARFSSEPFRSLSLLALVPDLGTDERSVVALEQVWPALREVWSAGGDRDWFVRAVEVLGPYVSTDQLQKYLAPHLRRDQLDLISALHVMTGAQLSGGEGATRTIRAEESSPTLAAPVAHLSADQIKTALTNAPRIEDEDDRSYVISRLSPSLSRNQLQNALTAGRRIKNQCLRSLALSALAPHLSADQRSRVLWDALVAAREISNESDRCRALSALTRTLGADKERRVLMAALEAAMEMIEERWRSEVLSALIPHLTADNAAVQKAWKTAREILYEPWRSQALSAVAPHLSAEQLQETLETVRKSPYRFWRSEALSALAPHLSADQRCRVLAEAVTAARWFGTAEDSSRALSALAPALSVLAPHLGTDERSSLLEATLAAARERGIGDWARALAALGSHLSADQIRNALVDARTISDKSFRSRVLLALAPYLVAKERSSAIEEAMADAREISEADDRARALLALASHLSAEQRSAVLSDALAAARQIVEEGARFDTLSVLAPHLAQLPREQVFEHWLHSIRFLTQNCRGALMRDLLALKPVLLRLAGGKVADELAMAIYEVGRRWP